MDIQDYVNTIIAIKRKERLETSPQLTLGKLISEIEACDIQNDKGEDKDVEFDFGSAEPTSLSSWRGSYAELALGFRLTGYDAPNQETGHHGIATATKLLDNLMSAIGATFEGWKGGDFIMDEDTPVWVANQGNVGNTAIVGVLNQGWRLVLLTAYCEY